MQLVKNIIYAIIMFLLGIAFCGLIYWEIKFGTAAGSYGSFDIHSAMGGFLWLIVAQFRYVFLIFSEVVKATRSVFTGKAEESKKSIPGERTVAVAILGKAAYGIIWGLLSVWLLVDMFYLACPVLAPLALDTSKRIFERLFLPSMMIMCLGIFVYLMVTLFFLDLFKDVFPKVPAAYRLLTGRSIIR